MLIYIFKGKNTICHGTSVDSNSKATTSTSNTKAICTMTWHDSDPNIYSNIRNLSRNRPAKQQINKKQKHEKRKTKHDCEILFVPYIIYCCIQARVIFCFTKKTKSSAQKLTINHFIKIIFFRVQETW